MDYLVVKNNEGELCPHLGIHGISSPEMRKAITVQYLYDRDITHKKYLKDTELVEVELIEII